MNKTRRNEIKQLISMLSICKDRLSTILNAEEDYYDNMPENLQGSMRGCDSEDAIDILNEAMESLEECMETLGGI